MEFSADTVDRLAEGIVSAVADEVERMEGVTGRALETEIRRIMQQVGAAVMRGVKRGSMVGTQRSSYRASVGDRRDTTSGDRPSC